MTTASTKLARRMLAKALMEMSANTNDAPRIRTGKHAGRADLNKLRDAAALRCKS